MWRKLLGWSECRRFWGRGGRGLRRALSSGDDANRIFRGLFARGDDKARKRAAGEDDGKFHFHGELLREFLREDFANYIRIGLAMRKLHYLAFEEIYGLLFAGFVLGDGPWIRFDRLKA